MTSELRCDQISVRRIAFGVCLGMWAFVFSAVLLSGATFVAVQALSSIQSNSERRAVERAADRVAEGQRREAAKPTPKEAKAAAREFFLTEWRKAKDDNEKGTAVCVTISDLTLKEMADAVANGPERTETLKEATRLAEAHCPNQVLMER